MFELRLAERRVQFVAQAQVERQVGRHLPVVLREEGPGVAEAVHGGLVGGADLGVIGIAEQESGVGIADGLAHIGRAVEDVPAGAVVAEDVVVVVGEALEVDAEFEGVVAAGPGDVVEGLNDLAALHAGIARAGGHETVDEHLRRFGPFGVGLGNGEAGLRQQRRGGVALRLRGVLGVEAGAEFVEQPRREDEVVGEGQAFVDLRRVVGALQRAARLGAVGEGAGGEGAVSDLAVLVGEARKDRLPRGDRAGRGGCRPGWRRWARGS